MASHHVEATAVNIDTAATLNEIVAEYPQALHTFKQFGLDTCCGGGLPLAVAAEHHHLDLQTVLTALHKAVEEAGS